MTINDLLRESADQLIQAGFIHGQREAEIILGHFGNLDTAKLFTQGDDEASEHLIKKVRDSITDRTKGKPLAYVVGSQQFLNWRFKSDERALIPRPETELLVELLIKIIRSEHRQEAKLLELGTGAGVISIALKKYFPHLSITATDISAEALELAQDNALALNAEINFVESDLFTNIEPQPFDIIVANLPYVPTERLAFVTEEILDWEPTVAIEAEEDGYAIIRRMLNEVKGYLSPTSVIALEMWHTHGPLVEKQVSSILPHALVEIEKDLAGFDRFALIRR